MNKSFLIIYVAIAITFLIALIEITPLFLWILKTNDSIGNTSLNSIYQKLFKYHLDKIGWIGYMLFFILLIVLISYKLKNVIIKTLLIILCIIFIVAPCFPILILINLYLRLRCRNPPFIYNYSKVFPPGKKLESSYSKIVSEFLAYETSQPVINCIKKNNPGFRIEKKLSNDENCWRSLYLKKLGKINKSLISFFPTTMRLLKHNQIHNAFFSILDPNVEISPHVGYYKGYLRYHLGIIIPEKNGKKPYLVCGGIKYKWENGKGIVFDDMFHHYVRNPTGQKRVILYLDIKRNNLSFFDNFIVGMGYRFAEMHPLVRTFVKNQHVQSRRS
jgi:beta-hydroxylase